MITLISSLSLFPGLKDIFKISIKTYKKIKRKTHKSSECFVFKCLGLSSKKEYKKMKGWMHSNQPREKSKSFQKSFQSSN